ncbi:hypothetical protein [Kutzneria buriramensis]
MAIVGLTAGPAIAAPHSQQPAASAQQEPGLYLYSEPDFAGRREVVPAPILPGCHLVTLEEKQPELPRFVARSAQNNTNQIVVLYTMRLGAKACSPETEVGVLPTGESKADLESPVVFYRAVSI